MESNRGKGKPEVVRKPEDAGKPEDAEIKEYKDIIRKIILNIKKLKTGEKEATKILTLVVILVLITGSGIYLIGEKDITEDEEVTNGESIPEPEPTLNNIEQFTNNKLRNYKYILDSNNNIKEKITVLEIIIEHYSNYQITENTDEDIKIFLEDVRTGQYASEINENREDLQGGF